MLNENIIVLTKKRSQLKQAVAKMVAESCTYLDKTPDKETQLKLINTLREEVVRLQSELKMRDE